MWDWKVKKSKALGKNQWESARKKHGNFVMKNGHHRHRHRIKFEVGYAPNMASHYLLFFLYGILLSDVHPITRLPPSLFLHSHRPSLVNQLLVLYNTNQLSVLQNGSNRQLNRLNYEPVMVSICSFYFILKHEESVRFWSIFI